MVRGELSDGVLQGQRGIISSDPAAPVGAHLVQLPANGLKPRVRPFRGLVRVRRDPVESPVMRARSP
jgi:hypothetical protein